MLSPTLAPVDNVAIGQHPLIIRLLKGVFNKRPPVRKLVPEWSLSLVSDCLQESHYEPLKDAALKHVTWKTHFPDSCHMFQKMQWPLSICLGEGNVNIQKKGVSFIYSGLAKQDRPGHCFQKKFTPAVPKYKLLDPEKALLYYLKQMTHFRYGRKEDVAQLVLATIKSRSPVSSQTISKWLGKVICLAYKSKQKSIGVVTGHSILKYRSILGNF